MKPESKSHHAISRVKVLARSEITYGYARELKHFGASNMFKALFFRKRTPVTYKARNEPERFDADFEPSSVSVTESVASLPVTLRSSCEVDGPPRRQCPTSLNEIIAGEISMTASSNEAKGKQPELLSMTKSSKSHTHKKSSSDNKRKRHDDSASNDIFDIYAILDDENDTTVELMRAKPTMTVHKASAGQERPHEMKTRKKKNVQKLITRLKLEKQNAVVDHDDIHFEESHINTETLLANLKEVDTLLNPVQPEAEEECDDPRMAEFQEFMRQEFGIPEEEVNDEPPQGSRTSHRQPYIPQNKIKARFTYGSSRTNNASNLSNNANIQNGPQNEYPSGEGTNPLSLFPPAWVDCNLLSPSDEIYEDGFDDHCEVAEDLYTQSGAYSGSTSQPRNSTSSIGGWKDGDQVHLPGALSRIPWEFSSREMEALDNVKLSDEELKSCLRYLFSHLSTAPLNNTWYQDNVTHAERLHTGKNAYVIDWLWKYDNVGIRNVSKLDAIADKESILKALKTNIKTFGELLSNIGAVINQQKEKEALRNYIEKTVSIMDFVMRSTSDFKAHFIVVGALLDAENSFRYDDDQSQAPHKGMETVTRILLNMAYENNVTCELIGLRLDDRPFTFTMYNTDDEVLKMIEHWSSYCRSTVKHFETNVRLMTTRLCILINILEKAERDEMRVNYLEKLISCQDFANCRGHCTCISKGPYVTAHYKMLAILVAEKKSAVGEIYKKELKRYLSLLVAHTILCANRMATWKEFKVPRLIWNTMIECIQTYLDDKRYALDGPSDTALPQERWRVRKPAVDHCSTRQLLLDLEKVQEQRCQ